MSRTKKRAPGRGKRASKVLPSVNTDSSPLSPRRESSNSANTGHRQNKPSTLALRQRGDPENGQEIMNQQETLDWYREQSKEERFREFFSRDKEPLNFHDRFKETVRVEEKKHLAHEREREAAKGPANLPTIPSYKLRYLKGLTDEQIDDLDRAEDARKEAAIRARWTREEITETASCIQTLDLTPAPEPESESEPEPEPVPVPRVSQLQASLPLRLKDASQRTRGGRITKSTAQIQSAAHCGISSGQTAPTPTLADTIMQGASDIVDKPTDSAVQMPRETRSFWRSQRHQQPSSTVKASEHKATGKPQTRS